jgi:hypothetical protein
VDGVCCSTACNGQCEACNFVGSVGLCTPVRGAPRGARFACATDGSNCGGTCNGTDPSECHYPGATVSCRSASCENGTAVIAASCDGSGACPSRQTENCGSFQCGPGACLGDCSNNAECKPGDFCSAGICKSQFAAGAVCGSSDQCASGHCVDGVCCNSACSGQCEACDLPSALGTCTPISGAPHGRRDGCVSDGSACGGACDGLLPNACTYPGISTACRAGECVSGTSSGGAICDGTGHCPAGPTTSCGPYACGASTCLTTCTSDSECATGYSCVGESCAPSGQGKNWEVSRSGCSTGSGAPWLFGVGLALIAFRRRFGRAP